MRNYFRELEKSHETVSLFEAKLLIVGPGRVGKTCLLNKLMDPDYEVDLTQDSTDGIDIHKWPIKIEYEDREIDFRINFWDFGGQEIYHATHQFFLTKRSLYLYIWTAREDERTTDFDYWLNVIRLLSGESPTLMVMNKSDERIREIEQESIRKLFPNVERFHQVSALNARGMDDLRRDIKEFIADLPHIGDKLPEVWIDIRRELEELNENFVSHERFLEICGKHGLDAPRADFLSDYFHDLGIFLHFKETKLLEDILILKPEWGTAAVYDVLNDPQIREAKGRFNRADLKRIWERYPADKRPHLLQLMEKFELCFRLGDSVDSNKYVAPELMSPDRSALAQEHSLKQIDAGVLRFEYRYDFMPAGIITRFIVRLHQNIYRGIYWKNGVWLKYSDALVEVISEPLKRKIKITATGKERRAALYHTRNELRLIHATLNNPFAKQMLPCICSECRANNEPEFFEYADLKKAQTKNVSYIQCRKSFEDVAVEELLEGISYTPLSSKTMKNSSVFISYSHKDKKHLDRLQVHLRPFERQSLNYFDDTKIAPGEDWRKEIDVALKNAQVAVLLLSADFLASYFIHKFELPVLLAAAEKKGLRILQVLLSYTNVPPELSRFQGVHDFKKPLRDMKPHKREEVWKKLAGLIQKSVED